MVSFIPSLVLHPWSCYLIRIFICHGPWLFSDSASYQIYRTYCILNLFSIISGYGFWLLYLCPLVAMRYAAVLYLKYCFKYMLMLGSSNNCCAKKKKAYDYAPNKATYSNCFLSGSHIYPKCWLPVYLICKCCTILGNLHLIMIFHKAHLKEVS